jgi:ribose 5-phosphate isomerase RpiB
MTTFPNLLPNASHSKSNCIKMALVAGATAAVVTFGAQPLPAKADLATSIKAVEGAMNMLSTVADTGVAIALTPFGISFALNIAKTVLRAGT